MVSVRSSQVTANRVIGARTTDDVLALIAALPVASWRPLGGKRGNYAQVNVASNPADALIEKITNGMDALIEQAVLRSGRDNFTSPRDAVDQLLGVPNGHVANITEDVVRRRMARDLVVTLCDSGSAKEPSVVIEDHGVGQHPDDFGRTLVSLNEDNKRRQMYLIGAYGWGGASAFAFSKYAVFMSRREPSLRSDGQRDEVGWTIVRYNDLADDLASKTGVYEYLCVGPEDGPEIPRFDPGDLPQAWADWHGTVCTLVQYELSRYSSEPAFRPSRSLWILGNALLFDPVLPFLVRDERQKSVAANSKSALDGIVINGNASRLAWDADKKEKNRRIAYSGRWQGRISDESTAVVSYYVIAESGEPKKDWEPTHTYVPPEQAVTVTHNGQRQGSYSRDLFEKLGLLSLSRFLIVHVDCDNLSWRDKKTLFSSTRDRLKESPIAQLLRDEVEKALRSDEHIRQIDRERKEAALSRRSKEHAERIKGLLREAIKSLRAGKETTYKEVTTTNTDLPSIGEGLPLVDEAVKPGGPSAKAEALPLTGAPTMLKVLTNPIRVPAGGRAVVRLRLDAADDYVSAGNYGDKALGTFVGVVTKGSDMFRVDGFSSLRDGTMRCTVSGQSAGVGERGRAIFTVIPSDGGVPLVDEAEITSVEPPQKRLRIAGSIVGKESGPNIEDIHKEQWSAFGFDEKTIAKLEENSPKAGETTIYFNWDYPPLDAKLLSEKKGVGDKIDAYKEKFGAAMALLVWLQHTDNVESQGDELRRAADMFLFSEFVPD